MKFVYLALVTLAVFMGCKSSPSTQPENDTTPPTIAITSPVNNSNVSDSVLITIEASDDKKVSKVEIYIDGILVCTRSSAPWQYQWKVDSLPANTTHPIVAMAYDAANNKGWSDAVRVNVFSNIDYFPLEVGNTWVYDCYLGRTYDWEGRKWIDTVTWEIQNVDSSRWPHNALVKVSTRGIYVYGSSTHPGDTSYHNSIDSMQVVQDANGHLTIAQPHISFFRYNGTQPGDTIPLKYNNDSGYQEFTIKKNVGMIYYYEWSAVGMSAYALQMRLREYHLK